MDSGLIIDRLASSSVMPSVGVPSRFCSWILILQP